MTPEAVTRSLYEFIVTYMHAVSYVANVYPKESYNLVRQYGTSTYQSAHPGVRLWIENASKSVMQLVYAAKNRGSGIILSIVILEDGIPKERFGIDIVEFETSETPASQSQPRHVAALDVSEQFRSCLVRLYTSGDSSDNAETKDRSMSLFFEGNMDLPDIPSLWLKTQAPGRNTHRIKPIRSIEINSAEEKVLVLNTFRQLAE